MTRDPVAFQTRSVILERNNKWDNTAETIPLSSTASSLSFAVRSLKAKKESLFPLYLTRAVFVTRTEYSPFWRFVSTILEQKRDRSQSSPNLDNIRGYSFEALSKQRSGRAIEFLLMRRFGSGAEIIFQLSLQVSRQQGSLSCSMRRLQLT